MWKLCELGFNVSVFDFFAKTLTLNLNFKSDFDIIYINNTLSKGIMIWNGILAKTI